MLPIRSSMLIGGMEISWLFLLGKIQPSHPNPTPNVPNEERVSGLLVQQHLPEQTSLPSNPQRAKDLNPVFRMGNFSMPEIKEHTLVSRKGQAKTCTGPSAPQRISMIKIESAGIPCRTEWARMEPHRPKATWL